MIGDSLLKEAGIDTDEGMKYSGDSKELYDSVLEIFVGSVEEQRDKMRKQLADKNYQGFAISAHSVKSNSRTIGAGELFKLALAMEKSGDNEDVDYINDNWDEFIKSWDKVNDGISSYLANN